MNSKLIVKNLYNRNMELYNIEFYRTSSFLFQYDGLFSPKIELTNFKMANIKQLGRDHSSIIASLKYGTIMIDM